MKRLYIGMVVCISWLHSCLCDCFILSMKKTLYRYGCRYFLVALVLVCVDVMLMSSA